ncbi:MAG: hypothetical protein ACXWK6_06785 [Myxococcaceae bacterium]
MQRGPWFALFVCTVGCGGGTGSSESFLTALPSRQTLEVTAPTSHAPAALSARSAALVGQTASLYVLTRQMTGQVNGFVGGALDMLGTISRTPPAAVGPDSAAWGPFTDALSPVAGRLIIVRVGPGAHTFRLDLRPKSGGDAEFQPFLQGASTGAAPGGPSQGAFSVDLDLAHRLDPVANPTEGHVVAGWALPPGQREVQVHLGDAHGPTDPPASADIASVLRADGSGSLVFDALANLVGSPDSLEAGQVRSRWIPTGAGRADVELHGGDAADGAQITECWDASFGRVYANATTPDSGIGTEGEASACVFGEPLR